MNRKIQRQQPSPHNKIISPHAMPGQDGSENKRPSWQTGCAALFVTIVMELFIIWPIAHWSSSIWATISTTNNWTRTTDTRAMRRTTRQSLSSSPMSSQKNGSNETSRTKKLVNGCLGLPQSDITNKNFSVLSRTTARLSENPHFSTSL